MPPSVHVSTAPTFPDYVLAAREALLESSDGKRDELAKAIRHMDAEAERILVTIDGTKTGLLDVLKEAGRMRREPRETHVLVHPTWPWHPSGFGDLRSHAVFRMVTEGNTPKDTPTNGNLLAEQWRSIFFAKMNALLASHPHCIVIEDPTPVRAPPLETRYCPAISSVDIGANGATGFLAADSLVRSMEGTDGWMQEDRTVISGATYARCPQGFAVQHVAASRFGFFFSPRDKSQKDASSEGTLWSALEDSHCYAASNAHFGTLLDCEQRFPRPSGSITQQMTDEHTIVLPQQDEECMRAVREDVPAGESTEKR